MSWGHHFESLTGVCKSIVRANFTYTVLCCDFSTVGSIMQEERMKLFSSLMYYYCVISFSTST